MAGPEKKLERSKSGLRMIPVSEADTSPFCLPEPPWVPDDECKQCQNCRGKFDFFKRRKHHCRRCGRCFCNDCCQEKVNLPRMQFLDPVRHCQVCTEVSRKEEEFFDKHLKSLQNGGYFSVCDSDIGPDDASMFFTKLSPNHRHLLFEGDSDKHEPILIEKIETLQILPSGKDDEGNTIAGGIAIKYKDTTGGINVIKMMVDSGGNRKPGQIWIASMQKAFKMLYDARAK
ncbi:zinc finger FYVE domain-containing protein 21 isoform X2 [Magallana gigas]|uniref:zinc finger FYVE domain-containing protein 21 isoform X2 n=1 Tax=Magallana gigas TaxID=29159 RepID=UPI0005C3AA03|eukprot:XP_011455421.1 PREDICTED: zinc finger FYVE domain-containing protein 21 isoform X2 [Crassostrea gigas]